MRKYIFYVLLLLVLAGCSDEIESNSPSIQGVLNNQFFRANDATATLNPDGSVTLIGSDASKIITLKAKKPKVGVYELGLNEDNAATFQILDSLFYTTGTTGNGQIEITEEKDGALSGTFYFNARLNGISGDTLNFNKGSFFGVQVMNVDPGDTQPDLSCEEATTNTAQASAAYIQAQSDGGTAQEIEDACQAYKEALQDQIDVCGDPDGALQAIMDNLPCG